MKIKKRPVSVDLNKLLELYALIQNGGKDQNASGFMSFLRREKTDSEQYSIFMEQILLKLVDIINEPATIKMPLATKLTPFKVDVRDLIK